MPVSSSSRDCLATERPATKERAQVFVETFIHLTVVTEAEVVNIQLVERVKINKKNMTDQSVDRLKR